MVEKSFLISSKDYNYDGKGDLNSGFSDDYSGFENTYNTFYEGLFEKDEIYIPESAFSNEIGCFQAIVRYLKDNKLLKFSEIAKLTGRDPRTIWNVYNQTKGAVIKTKQGSILIPLSIINDRKFSVLENLTLYLKNKGLSFTEIAAILKRNYQTVYTTYRKAWRKAK